MTDLQEIRKQIDEVDEQIVRLFERRMKLTKEVAEYRHGKTGIRRAKRTKEAGDTGRESDGSF